MEIFQEVSSVQDASLAAGLITNRRAIESNVLVDDGQIVVLGGLIQDTVEGNVSKVPLLGDIPVFGACSATTAARAPRPTCWCSCARS